MDPYLALLASLGNTRMPKSAPTYPPYPQGSLPCPRCIVCGNPLPFDTPSWQTMCRTCFIEHKRREEQEAREALLKRALEAESRVELAKRVVIDLQARIRALEGEARRAAGKVGLAKGAMPGAAEFSTDELKALRRLVHPDKHNGSESANALAARINQLLRDRGE